mmetsp:Transcript_27406/g.80603  ORF Transcript_27406/g.80603 Transcript_27406/m.80603 type:complete len:280 (-) Transcript_27406:53-892(-)
MLSIERVVSSSAAIPLFYFLIHPTPPLLYVSGTTVINLAPDEFRDGILNGDYDALVDVRTHLEWSSGRIPNATLLDSLADFGTSREVSTPALLNGCERCRIALYCRSGRRAGLAAIRLIEEAEFEGPIYNGGGVQGWVEAGFRLVSDGESVSPPCACEKCGEGQCREDEHNTEGSPTDEDDGEDCEVGDKGFDLVEEKDSSNRFNHSNSIDGGKGISDSTENQSNPFQGELGNKSVNDKDVGVSVEDHQSSSAVRFYSPRGGNIFQAVLPVSFALAFYH